MSIHVSKKHGVNPSLDLCFWCGEAKGVALLGYLPNDAEAPREMVTSYDPCDTCKSQFESGITFIEVSASPLAKNQPPIQKDIYPTGNVLVVKEEAVSRIFTEPQTSEIIKARTCLLDQETFAMLRPETK